MRSATSVTYPSVSVAQAIWTDCFPFISCTTRWNLIGCTCETNLHHIGSVVKTSVAGLCSYLVVLTLDSRMYCALQVACLVCGGDGC